MKRTAVLAIVFGALWAVSVATASAESLRTMAGANVPFDFSVGNTAMPAGAYSILTDGSGIVVIRNDQSKKGVVAIGGANTSAHQGSARLVFHRYGDNYHLSQIGLFAGNTILLRPSKAGKERGRNGSNSVAAVALQPEVVQIALTAVR